MAFGRYIGPALELPIYGKYDPVGSYARIQAVSSWLPLRPASLDGITTGSTKVSGRHCIDIVLRSAHIIVSFKKFYGAQTEGTVTSKQNPRINAFTPRRPLLSSVRRSVAFSANGNMKASCLSTVQVPS